MEIIGDNIDRLTTVEIKKAKNLMRGRLHLFYEAARKKLGGKPISFVAASRLMESVRKNDNVIVTTGTSCPTMPHGETDGPPGAAAIARVICFGLQATPIFVVAQGDVEPVVATARAAGLNVDDYDIAKPAEKYAAIVRYPYQDEEAKQSAKEIIEKYSPKALFSVETMGPNRKGIVHSSLGYAIRGLAPFHHLYDEARKKGILTIGCLDNGNEIGSGLIEETVSKVAPYGPNCRCSCQSGIACVTATDVAFPVITSNWGAYGIAAMLAFMLKDASLLHDSDTEKRMLEACTASGGVDAQSLSTNLIVDGIPGKCHQGVIDILHAIIESGLFEGNPNALSDVLSRST
ncbi:glutamate cyclase domain-containing protein [Chloroflexota bacterium]